MKTEQKERIGFALLMGVVTTGLISFLLIAVNLGFRDTFLTVWLKSWMMAYVAVIPAIIFIGPVIQGVVKKLVRK